MNGIYQRVLMPYVQWDYVSHEAILLCCTHMPTHSSRDDFVLVARQEQNNTPVKLWDRRSMSTSEVRCNSNMQLQPSTTQTIRSGPEEAALVQVMLRSWVRLSTSSGQGILREISHIFHSKGRYAKLNLDVMTVAMKKSLEDQHKLGKDSSTYGEQVR